jgi:beta-lactamase class A
MTLLDILTRASNQIDGTLGVYIKHLETGEEAEINGDRVFPSASLRKIPIALEFYKQVDEGLMDPEEKVVVEEKDKVPGTGIIKELRPGLELSLRDLVRLMLILSDNTATSIIVDRIGRDNVNSTTQDLGLENTKLMVGAREIIFNLIGLDHIPMEEKTINTFRERVLETKDGGTWSLGTEKNNTTTPKDMFRLLELIARKKAASIESCNEILMIMGRCQTGANRIPKYLPQREVEVAHKTGSLPGIRNDVGLVTFRGNGESYIIACLTQSARSNLEAEEAIASLSRDVYDYFKD